jgi:phosphoribosylformylglycinamidine synthase
VRQWRFEVFNRPGFPDVHGNSILEEVKELGISSVEAVQSAKVFLIEAGFDKDFASRLAKELLTDPVCEEYYIGRSSAPAGLAKATLIEVHLKSGVTDPVAKSVMTAIADMGVKVGNVRTARKYILLGEFTQSQIDTIAKKILANDCIEEVVIGNEAEPPGPHLKPYEFQLTHWPVRNLEDDELIKLSKEKDLC